MHITSIVLQILLGLAFLMAGVMKVSGQQMHIDNFNRWRLPQWFRPVTGWVEIVGGAGMLAGIWVGGLAAWAGIWLGITMLVGLIVHFRVKDKPQQWSGALVLLILSAAVAALRFSELS